jgi:hypothetical protein
MSTRESVKNSRLSSNQELVFGVPKQGAWFFTLKPMLANAPSGAFLVAWDTPPNDNKPKGAKCYGYYESPTIFFQQLSANVLKCGYEVFVHGSQYSEYSARSTCLAYGDLEWVGDEDKEHRHARELLRRLHNICLTRLQLSAEIYVLCGTRQTEDGTKNSYHFIIANLYAEKCEDIKQLFMPETLHTGADDDVVEFDLKVYATVQCMRPALCAKRGSKVPLRRINTDPYDAEDNLTASFADEDVAAIMKSLVTVFDKSKATMKLLEPFTLQPKPPNSAGTKRQSSQASFDTNGRDSRPRITTPLTYSSQLANNVSDQLVAMHPDPIGVDYDTWRNVMFAAINEAGAQTGAPPELIEMLKEWTRIRKKANHRNKEWPRIAAGIFGSAERRVGDNTTIGMGSLIFHHKQYPAAYTHNRASNVDPLPNCAMLLAPEDVWLFELFEQFLRHVDYQQTSFKWLVQFASYIVPKLKVQVYETFQVEYAGITKDDFDGVWNVDQPSDIYELAFKRYLLEIVKGINSNIPPMVETTVCKSDGEAKADGIPKTQEAVTTVSHIRAAKPKARDRQSKPLTKEQVLTYIVKTSASVHCLEAPKVIRKAIRGALNGQKDVDKDTEELLRLWAVLEGKSSKTGTTYTHAPALSHGLNF